MKGSAPYLSLIHILDVYKRQVFYGRYFGWCRWGELVLPALTTLAPPLVFALGSGWQLGRVRPWLTFLWMLLPILLTALPLPESLGLLNGSIFVSRPLALGVLDPAFSLPVGAIVTQCVLLLAGVLFLTIRPSKRKIR